MGAGDHLVAVSNYDQARAETQHLPRVGDYRTVDWEQIAALRPAVMVVQFRPDKMPAGLEDRAKSYGVRVVNIRIVRLDDVFASLAVLGDATGERAKADQAAGALRRQLDAVRARVAGRPPVRTYVGRTSNPLEAVGGGNFVDDLLAIAGGANVLAGPGHDDNSFPAVDREQLRALDPDAALNLLPAAPPQVVAEARRFWATLPEVSAVRGGRVYDLTEPYVLWPGMNVGRVAERFAEVLHPATAGTTQPATRPAATPPRAAANLGTGFQPVRVGPGIGQSRSSPLQQFTHGLEARVTSNPDRLLEHVPGGFSVRDTFVLDIARTGWKPVPQWTGRTAAGSPALLRTCSRRLPGVR